MARFPLRPSAPVLAAVLAVALSLAAPAAVRAAECILDPLATLPVTMIGAQPTIPVTINGKAVRFIVDSGSFVSALTPGFVASAGIHTEAQPRYNMTGISGRGDLRTGHVKDFGLAGVVFHNVNLAVIGVDDSNVAGLIGQDILSKVDVEYDFADGVMRLLKPRDCGSGGLAYWAKTTAKVVPMHPTSGVNHPIVTDASINGQSMIVVMDTGANRSAVALAAAARAGLTPQMPGAQRVGQLTGITGATIDDWITPVDDFSIGTEDIRHTRIRIGGMQVQGFDMLLGVDFFLSHRVLVSNSQQKVYFTYNGGPVFRLDDAPSPPPVVATGPMPAATPEDTAAAITDNPTNTPKDADGFIRRAAAYVAQKQYQSALADLNQAILLDPHSARAYMDRATLRLALRQALLALADLDEAIKAKPDFGEALMLRGIVLIGSGDADRGLQDVEAAIKAGVPDVNAPLTLAVLYEQTGHYQKALDTFDRWASANPNSPRLAIALNGGCWERALLKKDLDRALGDCDAALKLQPQAANIFDSRGMVHLDRGEYDLAIADYDTALNLQPKAAITLYARAVAEARKGLKDQSDADARAAVELDVRVTDQAKRLGLMLDVPPKS
jgi:tetratricopeptide (TPR) repeat protein/predicted aspartyl protease